MNDPEYQVTIAIAARKADVGQRHPIADRVVEGLGDDDSARTEAITFLAGAGPTIDEWGDLDVDPQDHTSQADGILLAHILEHSWGWRRILTNAVSSFGGRLVVILSTPLGDSEMRLDNEKDVPVLQLPREEVFAYFRGMAVREETIATDSGAVETVLYVEK